MKCIAKFKSVNSFITRFTNLNLIKEQTNRNQSYAKFWKKKIEKREGKREGIDKKEHHSIKNSGGQ